MKRGDAVLGIVAASAKREALIYAGSSVICLYGRLGGERVADEFHSSDIISPSVNLLNSTFLSIASKAPRAFRPEVAIRKGPLTSWLRNS